MERAVPLVYSLCRRAGLEQADAEDVAQEVMVSALGSLDRFGGCRLTTWLYRLARRRLADHFRSRRRREVPHGTSGESPLEAATAGTASDPERQVVRSSEEERIRGAVGALGEPARSVVLAYYLGEVPVKEIAQEMEMPENTVKSHLRRARTALRRGLGDAP